MFDSLLNLWNKWFGGSTTPTPSEPEVVSHGSHVHLKYNLQLGVIDTPIPGEINGDQWDSFNPNPLASSVQALVASDEFKASAALAKRLTKQTIIAAVIDVEAGYVNHPNDKGGETNFGITKAVATENKTMLVKKFNWDGTMKGLSYDMAFALYELQYWTPLRLDDIVNIEPLLADKLFDIGVNCGVSRSGLWLKQILNVLNREGKDYADISTTTGFVGDQTVQTIKSLVRVRGHKPAMKALLTALLCRQGYHYIDISISRPANEAFTFGWLTNRMQHHLDLYSELFG